MSVFECCSWDDVLMESGCNHATLALTCLCWALRKVTVVTSQRSEAAISSCDADSMCLFLPLTQISCEGHSVSPVHKLLPPELTHHLSETLKHQIFSPKTIFSWMMLRVTTSMEPVKAMWHLDGTHTTECCHIALIGVQWGSRQSQWFS